MSKKALVIGAGAAGRGMEGLELSRAGYDVVFADCDPGVVDALRRANGYEVSVPETGRLERVEIAGAVSIDDKDALNGLFQQHGMSLVVTAVGPDNLETVARKIATPLYTRALSDNPINVMACEGVLNNTGMLKDFVFTEWRKRVEDNESMRKALESIGEVLGFPLTLVDRISILGDDGIVRVEDESEWLVEYKNWKGGRGASCMRLFPSEELKGLMLRKLYMLNGAHATIGFMGERKGIRTVHEALEDEEVARVVAGQLDEAGCGLAREYDFDPKDQAGYASRTIRRIGNATLADTTERLRRGDPRRKLGRADRFVGPALLALKHGRAPENIATGMAYMLGHTDPNSQAWSELNTYIREHGIRGALERYCGLVCKDYPQHAGLADLVADKYDTIARL